MSDAVAVAILQTHLNRILVEVNKQRNFCKANEIIKTPENRLAAIVRNAHHAETATDDDRPSAVDFYYAVAANAINAILDLEKL